MLIWSRIAVHLALALPTGAWHKDPVESNESQTAHCCR